MSYLEITADAIKAHSDDGKITDIISADGLEVKVNEQ